MRQIKPLILTVQQREAWLQFAKQAVEPQTFQLTISSPLKQQRLSLSASLVLPLFLAAPEMRDDPPLRRWQAWVGDGIAKARNIDRGKKKSSQSRASEKERKEEEKKKNQWKLKKNRKCLIFIAWREFNQCDPNESSRLYNMMSWS